MPTIASLREYDAHVDAKKRLTIRGALHEYFRVLHLKDGSILLKPRVLKDAPIFHHGDAAGDDGQGNEESPRGQAGEATGRFEEISGGEDLSSGRCGMAYFIHEK